MNRAAFDIPYTDLPDRQLSPAVRSPEHQAGIDAQNEADLQDAIIAKLGDENWILDLIGNNERLSPLVMRLADLPSHKTAHDMTMNEIAYAADTAVSFSEMVETITREHLEGDYL